MIPFPGAFIIKGSTDNGRNPPSCLIPAFLTPFIVITFINEEVNGCTNDKNIRVINKVPIGAI